MAAGLQANNLSGVAVITNPGGLKATPYNMITLYDYYTQFQPHLMHELYYANGRGDITGILDMNAAVGTYASDVVKHSEMGRLHNRLTGVTLSTNTFTSPTPHNLKVGMEILISDGVIEKQAVVSSITSATVFVALNKETGAWGLDLTNNNTLDISTDFSNSWAKGTENFTEGYKWEPDIYENNTHILKWIYTVSNSDRAHIVWIDCPDGVPRWCNVELERSQILFNNLKEITQFFRRRTDPNSPAAGLANTSLGLQGIVPTIENYGNLVNGYITSVADLEDFALRIAEQGGDAKEYYILSTIEQMNHFNAFAATVSSDQVGGANYGAFNNNPDMALYLDFKSIYVSGITFHFKPWKILNDPTILSYGQFNTTGFSFLGIPVGKKNVIMDSREVRKPYLQILYRGMGDENRRDEVQVFGRGGTPHKKDTTEHHFLTEMTNQVVGANMFFVGRKDTSFYS